MIYPKFSQKQLAFVVVCLLLTLGAVGVSFLVYFFNEPLVLNTVYTKSERYDILLPQHVVLNKEFSAGRVQLDDISVDDEESNATVDSIELLNATDNFDLPKMSGGSGGSVDYDNDVSTTAEERQEAWQQNIYIDELDKQNIQIEEEGMNTPGVYYTSSKETTSNEGKRLKQQTIPTPYQYRTEVSLVKEPNLDQIYDNDSINMATANDDDEDGSGSGYFETPKQQGVGGNGIGIYDDDTNNFIRRISLKMLQTHGRPLHKQQQRPKRIRTSTMRPKRTKHQRERMHETIWRYNRLTDDHKTTTKPADAPPLRQLHGERRLTMPSSTIYRKQPTNTAERKQQQQNPVMSSLSSSERETLRTPAMNRQQQHSFMSMSPAWLETRTRRIIGNVKKSEERSRQLLLCEKEEAGGGELCRMLFKGHLND